MSNGPHIRYAGCAGVERVESFSIYASREMDRGLLSSRQVPVIVRGNTSVTSVGLTVSVSRSLGLPRRFRLKKESRSRSSKRPPVLLIAYSDRFENKLVFGSLRINLYAWA